MDLWKQLRALALDPKNAPVMTTGIGKIVPDEERDDIATIVWDNGAETIYRLNASGQWRVVGVLPPLVR